MKIQPKFHQISALMFVKHLLLRPLQQIQMPQIWVRKRKNLFSNKIVEKWFNISKIDVSKKLLSAWNNRSKSSKNESWVQKIQRTHLFRKRLSYSKFRKTVKIDYKWSVLSYFCWEFWSDKLEKPLFLIDINLAIPHVQFVPSLDELQQVLNKAARYIVETGKSITAWGQHRIHLITKLNEYGEETEVVEDIPSENLQNWYPVIQSNKGEGATH